MQTVEVEVRTYPVWEECTYQVETIDLPLTTYQAAKDNDSLMAALAAVSRNPEIWTSPDLFDWHIERETDCALVNLIGPSI